MVQRNLKPYACGLLEITQKRSISYVKFNVSSNDLLGEVQPNTLSCVVRKASKMSELPRRLRGQIS